MKKETYLSPSLEVSKFSVAEIMTSSETETTTIASTTELTSEDNTRIYQLDGDWD